MFNFLVAYNLIFSTCILCMVSFIVELRMLNNIIYFTFLTELFFFFFFNDHVLNSGGSILVLLLFRVVKPEYAAT